MNKLVHKSIFVGFVLAASASMVGCAFPNKPAPGPSAIAVDSTANQVWLVDSGKVYRCSPNGDALNCKEATTNVPR
jgi:hypothetical protein